MKTIEEIKQAWERDVDRREKQDMFDFMYRHFDRLLEEYDYQQRVIDKMVNDEVVRMADDEFYG